MKNLALFLLFVATAASTNAQTTPPSVTPAGDGKLITRFDVTYADRLYETKIWKAEDHEKGAWSESKPMGILGDCSPEVVDNPDKTGINQNAKCLKLTVGAGGYDNFKMYLPWNDSANSRFNLYGRRRISLSPSLTSFTNTLCFTLCFTRMDMRRRPFMSTSPSGRAALQCSLSHPPGLAASVIFRHLLPSCSTTVGVARSQKPPSLPSSLSSPFQITVWADA